MLSLGLFNHRELSEKWLKMYIFSINQEQLKQIFRVKNQNLEENFETKNKRAF